jgi:hypothetical protein
MQDKPRRTCTAYSPNSLRLRCVQRLRACRDLTHLKAVMHATLTVLGTSTHATTRLTTLQAASRMQGIIVGSAKHPMLSKQVSR